MTVRSLLVSALAFIATIPAVHAAVVADIDGTIETTSLLVPTTVVDFDNHAAAHNICGENAVILLDGQLLGSAWSPEAGCVYFSGSGFTSGIDNTDTFYGEAWNATSGYIYFDDNLNSFSGYLDSNGDVQGQAWNSVLGHFDLSNMVVDFRASDVAPRVLMVLDDFHHNESLADIGIIMDVIESMGVRVDFMDEPQNGLYELNTAGYDVVWFSNPGWWLDDSASVQVLSGFIADGGNVILQGDDMAWNNAGGMEELTGLQYINNGSNSNYDLDFEDNGHPLTFGLNDEIYLKDDIDTVQIVGGDVQLHGTSQNVNNASLTGPFFVSRENVGSNSGNIAVPLLSFAKLEPAVQIRLTKNLINWAFGWTSDRSIDLSIDNYEDSDDYLDTQATTEAQQLQLAVLQALDLTFLPEIYIEPTEELICENSHYVQFLLDILRKVTQACEILECSEEQYPYYYQAQHHLLEAINKIVLFTLPNLRPAENLTEAVDIIRDYRIATFICY